jgi:3-phenylpropionate/trans-cinnamate dioxygenase ferredoxin subunit
MAMIRIGAAQDITIGSMKGVRVGEKEILVSNLGGMYHAIGDKCTHRGCSLSKGSISGTHVICPCHHSTFDLVTGALVKGPAKEPEPSYVVRVENNELWLEL